MKIKLLGTLAVFAGSLLLASCGGGNGSNPYAGPAATQPLDTAQVLAIARTSSESSDPLPVDGGVLQVAGAEDDTSDPIAVI
ncbi:MAG: hypothetical protein PVSMB6_07500 [Steroidobacteraceae bacterium]